MKRPFSKAEGSGLRKKIKAHKKYRQGHKVEMKNSGMAVTISMLIFVFLTAACSKNPFEHHFGMQLPNDAKIEHYKNRSGFVDSSYIMVLSYHGDNVPDIIIQNLKLDKFLSVNGPWALGSEWPSWWQPEMIHRIADVYQRADRDKFAWFWFDRKNRYIYIQWGTH